MFGAVVVGGIGRNESRDSVRRVYRVLLVNLIFMVLTFAAAPDRWFDF